MLSSVSFSSADNSFCNNASISDQFSLSLKNTSNIDSQNFNFRAKIVSPVSNKIQVYRPRYDLRQTYREFDAAGFRGYQEVDIDQLKNIFERSQLYMGSLDNRNGIRGKDTERFNQIETHYKLYHHKSFPKNDQFPYITHANAPDFAEREEYIKVDLPRSKNK